jgi:predicted dehydrogenase
MNIVIVGLGGHAAAWRTNIKRHPKWKIVGIVDTDLMKLNNPEPWGVAEECAYPTISDAQKYSEERIDAVLLTTPTPTHHLLATEALSLGLNVICEKNMANNLEQAEAMVKLARNHPELCTAMGTQYRWRPNWWTLHQLFKDPDCPIGKLSMIHAQFRSKSGTMRSGWRAYLRDIFLEDMAVHHFDCFRYCTGMEVIKIQAQVFTPSYSQWLGSSTIFANMVLAPPGKEKIKEEYVYLQYHGDWQSTGLKQNWNENFQFYGGKGMVSIEPPVVPSKEQWATDRGQLLVGEMANSRIVAHLDNSSGGCTDNEIPKQYDIDGIPDGFMDQSYILEGLAQGIESKGKKQFKCNFEEGYKSFLVTQGALESMKTGKTVWLPKYWLENSISEP